VIDFIKDNACILDASKPFEELKTKACLFALLKIFIELILL